jgi:hypothetical protein
MRRTGVDLDWTAIADYSNRATVQAPKTPHELPGVTVERSSSRMCL